MRTIICNCEQKFNVDLPETINLDLDPQLIKEIQDGSFLTCICPTCGSTIKTDLKTTILWPSKNITILLIPENERNMFLDIQNMQTQYVIGYPELVERIAVFSSDLNPLYIEALKYYLYVQANESTQNQDITIFFNSLNQEKELLFYVYGMKENEIAVTKVPMRFYESIKSSAPESSKKELFESLIYNNYISINNILFEDNNNA